MACFGKLPNFVHKLTYKFIYFVGFRLFGYRKDIIIQNVSRAFPTKNYDFVRRITLANMYFMAKLPIEWLQLASLSKKRALRMIDVKNKGYWAEISQDDNNHILMTGHYHNWEMMALLPLITSKTVYGVYKEQRSELSNKLTRKWREHFGAQLIEMKTAGRFMLKHKRNPAIYVLIADQSPVYNKKELRFLNQNTYVINGVERLQSILDAKLSYLEINIDEQKKLEFNTTPLDSDKPIESYFTELEKSIHKAPEYWLWSHKRWKRRPDLD